MIPATNRLRGVRSLFDEFDQMHREMNRLFATPDRRAPHFPELKVDENAAVVTLDLPGVAASDVDLQIEDGVLTVRAERASQSSGNEEALLNERRTGTIEQSLRLPWRVDLSAVSAELNDGVLTVSLAKAAEEQARRIDVQSA